VLRFVLKKDQYNEAGPGVSGYHDDEHGTVRRTFDVKRLF